MSQNYNNQNLNSIKPISSELNKSNNEYSMHPLSAKIMGFGHNLELVRHETIRNHNQNER